MLLPYVFVPLVYFLVMIVQPRHVLTYYYSHDDVSRMCVDLKSVLLLNIIIVPLVVKECPHTRAQSMTPSPALTPMHA